MKAVKVSELIEALEFDSEFHVTRVDRQNGCVVIVDSSVMGAVEADDEESLGDLPGWEKEEVEIARAIADDSGERFVDPPDKFDFHEYRQMEKFIQRVADERAADQLWRAIKGRGAFRHFKDTASRLGLLEKWFAYRDEAMKKFVVEWAEIHEISLIDDTKPKSDA